MSKLVCEIFDSKKNGSNNFLPAINDIDCNLDLDLRNSSLTVETANKEEMAKAIDLIVQSFDILKAKIDNLSQPTINQAMPISIQAKPANPEECTIINDDDTLTTTNSESNLSSDSRIDKIQFDNETIETAFNKLYKTAHWAYSKNPDNYNAIADFLWTAIRELSIEFSADPLVEFEVGDVVEFYFGRHLSRESINSYMSAIIVDKNNNNNLVCVVPVTRSAYTYNTAMNMNFSVPEDISSLTLEPNEYITAGTAIFNGAKYVRADRALNVVGKASPEFMQKVFERLPLVFDFRKNTSTEDSSAICEVTNINSKIALRKVVAPALSKINPKTPESISAKNFVYDIGMDDNDKLIVQSFIAANNLYKSSTITYDTICGYLQENVKSLALSNNQMQTNLKNAFKNWVSTKPELDNYSKLSFLSLLNIFAEAMTKNK